MRANPRYQRGFWQFAIPALGAIAGGLISRRGSERAAEMQIEAGKQTGEQNIAMQREFAQQGIQWRVQDAQRAGLHPLYALGGNTPGFTPNPIPVGGTDGGGDLGVTEASQHIGRAFEANAMRADRELQRRLVYAQIGATNASAAENMAQAQYWASEVARRAQSQTPGVGTGVITGAYSDVGQPTAHPLDADAIQLKPDERMSRDSRYPGSTAARDNPSMRQFYHDTRDGQGFRMMWPATQPGQLPEEIDIGMYPMIIGANLARYGYRWLADLSAYVQGIPPSARRGRTVESVLTRLNSWLKSSGYIDQLFKGK